MRFTFFLLLLLLAGCSNIKVDTNLKPAATGLLEKSVNDERVKQYSAEQILQLNATTLGQVDADYCQDDPDGREPNQSYVIAQLKNKTAQRGGNGLVLDRCVQYNSALCYATLRCNGIAIRVPG